MQIGWVIPLVLFASLSACIPAAIDAKLPSGSALKISFYPGGTALDDLIIIDGKNYFGKAEYQMQDPLGDIGFRLKSGERVQAECKEIGKDLMGKDECKSYTVYRSSFPLIPEGTILPRPDIY
jgi:hypothetical protein